MLEQKAYYVAILPQLLWILTVYLVMASCTPEETCFETVTRYYDLEGKYLYTVEGLECEGYKY